MKGRRQLVLDTETTGLDPKKGERVCEIACLELCDGKATGIVYQQYVNPGRESQPEALTVHGLTTEFLATHPDFSVIAHDFLNFIDGAELIIHNAPFDVGFLENELKLMGNKETLRRWCPVIIDTRVLATECLPRSSVVEKLIVKGRIDREFGNSAKFRANSLDNLCLYYDVSLEKRAEHHGALIDCELLAHVYHCLVKEKLMLSQQREQVAINALPAASLFQEKPQSISAVPAPTYRLKNV